ncbi:unnamed protein product [Clonostachys byssicola]|uniref:Uncharacterized protein n=1 Tax=Clonostachys byssicola TaxID=160290 RepID=A0A9N9U9L3_9HYPO|nr:unnamed protein product [Clonostachys byssicola]
MPTHGEATDGKWWKKITTRLMAQATKVKHDGESDKRQQRASQQDQTLQPATTMDTNKVTSCSPIVDPETPHPLPSQSTQNNPYGKRVDSLRNRRARNPAATCEAETLGPSTSVEEQTRLYAALAHATHEGDEELVRTLLVDSGARVLPGPSEPTRDCGSFRCTIQPSPLHEAISMGHTNLASLLLDRFVLNGGQHGGPASGSEKRKLAEMRDVKGRTLLATACVAGNAEVVKKLLDIGAKTEIRDRNGLTALHLAARSPTPSPSVVKLLIDYGADKSARDDSWITLLQDAENNLLPEEVAILLRPAALPPQPKQRRKRPRVPLPKANMDHQSVDSNDGKQDKQDTSWLDGVVIRHSEREV